MIFRMPDGDIAEVSRIDYNSDESYYTSLMEVYGVKKQCVGIHNDVNQVDLIYGLILRQRPSRL